MNGAGHPPACWCALKERGGVSQSRIIVLGNEKGGAGKSTVAVHLATTLLHEGAKVVVLDLDTRQQSTAHFFANRAAWMRAAEAPLPAPVAAETIADLAALEKALEVRRRFHCSSTRRAPTPSFPAPPTSGRT